MKIRELREKTETELHKMLADARDGVRMLRFGIAARQVKNVREIRKEKKTIARLLTLLGEKRKDSK